MITFAHITQQCATNFYMDNMSTHEKNYQKFVCLQMLEWSCHHKIDFIIKHNLIKEIQVLLACNSQKKYIATNFYIDNM